MIYTLTLNPAVDRELKVAEVRFDSVLRASDSRLDYGGKGFNVSRLLQQMATASTVLGFVGGNAGHLLEDGLTSLGIQTDFVWIPDETRTNISIVTASHDHYIKVNEPGPAVSAARQQELLEKVETLAQPGDWWVLAGSLPPGIEAGFYARMVRIIKAHSGRALLDCSGEPLRLGCTEGPYLVKPNAGEAHEITGVPVDTPTGVAQAAAQICQLGPQNVAISMGRGGALLRTREGTWLAHAPQIEEKNPIGAGDAMVGGMVWALSRGLPLRESLGWGVASGAATASLSGTAVGSRALIEQLFSQVSYEELS